MQYFWPIKNGAAAISEGALLMAGITADTDLGVLIPATTAGTDAVGVLDQAIASTDTNTLVTGTAWLTRPVTPCVPMLGLEVDYDQTDTMAVASTSTTTVTVTSLEDNIDTSWLYAVSGTGVGKLAYLASSAAGSATSKTATSWDSTTVLIKILRLFHQLAKINTTADKIGTDAGAGSWTILILQNWLANNQYGAVVLDPTKHDNITGLNATGLGTRFYADVGVRNAGQYTID
jgi:hypothetical protein